MEGEKFKWDVGVQAIRGPFGEKEVEISAPFLAILFWNQPKGMDLKVWEGGGGDSKGPARRPSSTSSRRFLFNEKGMLIGRRKVLSCFREAVALAADPKTLR